MRTAFITSTGRTGTGFLTRLFNEGVPGAFSLHEPRPAFRRRAHAWMGRGPTLYERLRFKTSRNSYCRGRKESLYVENNYQLFAAFPLIRDVFPEARIIHIVRDGRQVTTSYLNRYRYIAGQHITPADVPEDGATELWADWSPVQRLAWYWATVNRHAAAQGPDLVLRFEDMFDEERSGLWRLLDSLDVDYDREAVRALAAERVNPGRRGFFPPYEEWPADWKAQFQQVAGGAMAQFGYVE